MIYRKWSLLTGPVVILGGVVGTVVVTNFLLNPFNRKPVKYDTKPTLPAKSS